MFFDIYYHPLKKDLPHALYLHLGLRLWYGNESFGKGKIPLIGWDCVGEQEWDSLIDSVEKDLKKIRRKGLKLIHKEILKVSK